MEHSRKYTNYNHRMRQASYDPGAEVAAGAALTAKCVSGEHDMTAAEKGRITHLPSVGRVQPGTRYCRRCGAVEGEIQIA